MSNAVGRAFYPRSGQTKDYKIGICCFSTKHVALRRKSKESGYCIRVGWHVYLTIILEIMHFSVNELKRCLITLHLSLNDLLRRSVDLMRSAYIPIIIRQELFEEIETVIKSFYPDLAFSELPSFQKLRWLCLSFSFNSELGFLLDQFSKKLLCKMIKKRVSYFNWDMWRWSGAPLILCFSYFICHFYILLIIKCN